MLRFKGGRIAFVRRQAQVKQGTSTDQGRDDVEQRNGVRGEETPRSRRGASLDTSSYFSSRGGQQRVRTRSTDQAPTSRGNSVESTWPHPWSDKPALGHCDPLEPFYPVMNDRLGNSVKLEKIIPNLIATKIQGHHELWYQLAYGRPCDRRVSGGYGLVSARLDEKRPAREKHTRVLGLTHITSWRSRPKQPPWNETYTSSPREGQSEQNRVTAIDYTNAEDVTLSTAQDGDGNFLQSEDALPPRAPRFLVHPYDKRKLAWDIFIAVLVVYGCVTIPLRIGFDLELELPEVVVDTVIDIMFLLDMMLRFRTAYFGDDGEVIVDAGDIAVRYLKGAFVIDLCSIIPIELVVMSTGTSGMILRSTKLLRTLRLLRLARLLKLTITFERQDGVVGPTIHPGLWSLIKMLVMLLFIAHLMGCMWHWLALLSSDGSTWITSYGVEDTSWSHRYLVCIYWAFTTMTTVGYGDITSASDLERGFAIVGMIIGATVFGYIIGNVAVIMENFDVVDAIEASKMDQIKDWLHDRKFPPALADKIRRQYRYIFKEVGVFDSTEIVDVMPGVMSTSLLYAQHRALAKGVQFLAKRPPVLVCRMVRRMVPCFASTGDVLYLEHEIGGHWYILRSGKVGFYVSLRPLETNPDVIHMRTLRNEGYFGHMPLLLNILSCETATARSPTDLLTIRKDDLVDILQQWPEVMSELKNDADRLFREIKVFRAAQLCLTGSTPPVHPILGRRHSLGVSLPCFELTAQAGHDAGIKLESPVSPLRAASSRAHPTTAASNAEEMAREGSPPGVVDRSADAKSNGDGARIVDPERVEVSSGGSDADPVGDDKGRGGQDIQGDATGGLCSGEPMPRAEIGEIKSESRQERCRGNRDLEDGHREIQQREEHQRGLTAAISIDLEAGGLRDEGFVEAKEANEMPEVEGRSRVTGGRPVTSTTEGSKGREARNARGKLAYRPSPLPMNGLQPSLVEGTREEGVDSPDVGTSARHASGEEALPDKGCFVAKTFSPSDLGLGENAGDDDFSKTTEKLDGSLESTMHRFWGRLGRGGQDGLRCSQRRGTAEDVFGIDEAQAAIVSMPPSQLFQATGMIHPEAPTKVSWDLFVSMMTVWSVMEVTFRLGFNRPARGGWIIGSYAIDLIFVVDMATSFRTALLTKDGIVIAHKRQAACAYLQGWFAVDLVATVPWDLLVLKVAVGNPSAAISTKLIRALRLARLVRLIRLLKIPDFMEEWETKSPFGPSSVRLGRLLVIMLFSAHINACVWYAAGLHSRANRNWIGEYFCGVEGEAESSCPEGESSFSLYLASIYFAFTTMTTTGYGDILANRYSVEELAVAIVSEVIGATIFAWVIGNLVNLVLNLDPAERNRKSMMSYLKEYMRELPLSLRAKKSISKNYAFHLQVHSVFNQPSIVGDLMPHLQNQVYVFLWRAMLPKMPFLCAMEDQVTGIVRVILPLLKPATFAPGDLITTPKVGTREMSFIISGEVEVRQAKGRRQYKKFTLGEGKHFGEITVLLPEHVPFRGIAQVRAVSNVRVMLLTRSAFSVLEERHPHVTNFVIKQLFEPDSSPHWVVVSKDFRREVERLAEMAAASRESTLETPQSSQEDKSSKGGLRVEGIKRRRPTSRGQTVYQERSMLFSPGRRSPSSSSIGVVPPREPALLSPIPVKAGGARMAGSRQHLHPNG